MKTLIVTTGALIPALPAAAAIALATAHPALSCAAAIAGIADAALFTVAARGKP